MNEFHVEWDIQIARKGEWNQLCGSRERWVEELNFLGEFPELNSHKETQNPQLQVLLQKLKMHHQLV